MIGSKRQASLRLLCEARDDLGLCREVEARCHAASTSANDYLDAVLRAAHNLRENATLGADVVGLPDSALIEGTLLGRIERERIGRAEKFEQMLQEKYEALDDQKFQAIVRCKRCGSENVTWDEKQTRSADEGATVFCMCTRCKLRWVMR
jgi:DNA-directed RNA polymerase subunit M/transcription elongation factor TFIIS